MGGNKSQETPYTGGGIHKITQEDLDANPELVEEGLKVGDEVIFTGEDGLLPEEKTLQPPSYFRPR